MNLTAHIEDMNRLGIDAKVVTTSTATANCEWPHESTWPSTDD